MLRELKLYYEHNGNNCHICRYWNVPKYASEFFQETTRYLVGQETQL